MPASAKRRPNQAASSRVAAARDRLVAEEAAADA